MVNEELLDKYNRLLDYFSKLGNAAIAYSSGVDSTFMLYAANEALPGAVMAVTAASNSFPARERVEAIDYCKELGIKHVVVETDELTLPGFTSNPPERCYICKKHLFSLLIDAANEAGISNVCEGSNLDDLGDYRPGLVAIKELGVKSPLREIGFTKAEIREISKHLGLPTYKKPSFACLATRFPYGELITADKLKMVEMAEDLLMDMGFEQVRVRIHGDIARIEIMPSDFIRFLSDDIRITVNNKLKEYGFNYVSLDLQGYRTGSMNETLTNPFPISLT